MVGAACRSLSAHQVPDPLIKRAVDRYASPQGLAPGLVAALSGQAGALCSYTVQHGFSSLLTVGRAKQGRIQRQNQLAMAGRGFMARIEGGRLPTCAVADQGAGQQLDHRGKG